MSDAVSSAAPSPVTTAPATNQTTQDGALANQSNEAEGGFSPQPSDGENSTESRDDKPAKDSAKQYVTVKVNGKDKRVAVEDLTRDYAKYEAASDKFREAARLAKSAEAFVKALQENPEAVLSDPRLPINKKELGEKWLRAAIEAELESPEAKAAREQAEELKKYKQREQEEMTRAEREQHQQLVNQRKEVLATTLLKAMELSPLAKDPETRDQAIAEMATYMRICKREGHEATPEEVAAHVVRQKVGTLSKLVGSLDVEDLIAAFGEDFITKVRKHDLQRLQAARQKPAPETVDRWESASSEPAKREFVDPYAARIKK